MTDVSHLIEAAKTIDTLRAWIAEAQKDADIDNPQTKRSDDVQ